MNTNSKNNLRDKLKESTREAILQAAVEIIISDPGDLRMEDIANRAGVAIGTLYNYFENRQMLIDTIIEKRRCATETFIRQSLEKTEGMDIISRLENLFETVFSFLEKHKTVTHHSLQAKENSDNKSGSRSFMTILGEYSEDIIQTALQRKEIRPEFSGIYYMVITGFFRAIFQRAEENSILDKKAEISRKMAELFVFGAGRNE